ncbi:MAG: TraR/DksA family transcriptional regulator [Desulfobulbaceae bacterium]|nr:TraR/DksA family transcriptional regulator [Desulfobulbaceae bacterium]
MDQFDQAQDLEERYRKQALEAHKKQAGKPGPGSEVCVECGDEIPIARREAVPGCELCIECQREIERPR